MSKISLTKRVRTRSSKRGTVTHVRYVLDYKDHATGKRRQEFFVRKIDADERRQALSNIEEAHRERQVLPNLSSTKMSNVADVVEYWLNNISDALKQCTVKYYRQMARYILVPTPVGTSAERRLWSRRGWTPHGVQTVSSLGEIQLSVLTTQMIRAWHTGLAFHVGHHTAHAAKKTLGMALRLASEELNLKPPPLPRTIARKKGEKSKKRVLTVQQVSVLVQAAMQDQARGLYYAFPFLTGVRPSEQLGLLWRDIDFERRCILIRRMQEPDGTICEFTKTEASTREIPLPPLLRQMLENWREFHPTAAFPESRVFVTQGTGTSKRHRAGSPLSYCNFRSTYWYPALKTLGLPAVSPHSARHSFISTLQASGVEVGLVAKLAGHSNPNITLGYYTQAVRSGIEPMAQLEKLYVDAAMSRTPELGER